MSHESNPDKPHDSPIDRKTFLRQGFFMMLKPLAGALEENVQKMTREVLRPPGALPELEFLAECTKCDLCMKACHQGAIRIADESYGLAIGTPIIVARETPCYLCDDMTCITACPTPALQPLDRREVRMGTAVINTKSCFAYQGQACDYCYARCPFPDEAIFMQDGKVPVVVPEKCTGCGICEHFCVTTTPAIRIIPA
ncbi:MAG: 4Fe-4S dicluster domain-containing protein [Nitrospirota bacterium]|nr:4Fe-4S dicluster domain-containing protein [Nitrospirota bacterium]